MSNGYFHKSKEDSEEGGGGLGGREGEVKLHNC